MRLKPELLCVALVIAGSSAWFVLSTLAMDEIPDAALMTTSLVTALAFVSAFAGTPSIQRVKAAGSKEFAIAGGAGMLTWLAPQLIVLSQRATDAPSGTETLFFTTAAWALMAALTSLGVREDRPSASQVAAVALSVLGAAALLANWERPSSFSPFIKFPEQELIMLFAGVVFASGLLLGRRSGRALGARSSLWIGVASAAVAAFVLALPAGFGSMQTFQSEWPQLLLAGAALATLATGMSGLVRITGTARATAWLVIVPVALTGLSVVERLTGVYGPNPIVWPGVLGGTIAVLAGLLAAQTYRGSTAPSSASDPPARLGFPRLPLSALALSALATVLAVVSLFLPAFVAFVDGILESGAEYSVVWRLSGAESAVGWLVLCVSALALALAVDCARQRPVRGLLVAAVSAVVALASFPLLADTPLHTWTRWIPAEVQHAYGTEYARLTFEAAPSAVRLAAAGFALAACIALIVSAVLGRRHGDALVHSALKEIA